MYRLNILMSVAVVGFFAQGNQTEAGHGHFRRPVPISIMAPVFVLETPAVYAVPVVVPQTAIAYQQVPIYIAPQPVVAPFYYPYYAAPAYAYPRYYHGYRSVKIKHKWRHGRYKVEYEFKD